MWSPHAALARCSWGPTPPVSWRMAQVAAATSLPFTGAWRPCPSPPATHGSLPIGFHVTQTLLSCLTTESEVHRQRWDRGPASASSLADPPGPPRDVAAGVGDVRSGPRALGKAAAALGTEPPGSRAGRPCEALRLRGEAWGHHVSPGRAAVAMRWTLPPRGPRVLRAELARTVGPTGADACRPSGVCAIRF